MVINYTRSDNSTNAETDPPLEMSKENRAVPFVLDLLEPPKKVTIYTSQFPRKTLIN